MAALCTQRPVTRLLYEIRGLPIEADDRAAPPMANEPERAEIVIEQALEDVQRQELAAKLEHEPGIVTAYYQDGNPSRLVVHYEIEAFSAATLLDLLRRHGVRGALD